MVALTFLVPLGLLVQQLAQERALGDARRQAAAVVGVLAVTTDPDAIERAIAGGSAVPQTPDGGKAGLLTGAGGSLAVHGLASAPLGAGHAGTRDITLASRLGESRTAQVPGGLSYLEPVDIGGMKVVVEAYIPAAVLRQGVHTAWYTLAGIAGALVLASVLFGDRLTARVVRSMHALRRAATAVGNGNLEMRVRPDGPREVAAAGLAFNQMADRLVAERIAEREQVADLSHRLRTPLTVLRLDAETLDAEADADPAGESDRNRTAVRIRHAISTLEREIDELIRTTREAARRAAATGNATAAAASAGAGSTGAGSAGGGSAGNRTASATGVGSGEQSTAERCDVGEVVRERMVFWSAVARDQDRPCIVLGAESLAPVPLPRADLAAALDAVVGNVLRYTPQGTALEVAVSRHDGWVALRVDDAGPGIPDPDRAVRRGVSDHGSTGLGLDIARRVTQAARGSVNIGRARLGGASVIMLFEDADEPPKQASRFGLIGRLAREPRKKFERRRNS